MRSFLLGLLVLCTCMSAFSQDKFTLKQLDSVYTGLYKTHRFNGTVLYAENGKVLYRKAFGVTDDKSSQPLATASSFNLASISKQFFAMGILILQERGQLNVDDPITKYLPELPYPGITIRNLLNHTSGITEYFDVFMRNRSPLDTLDNEKAVALFAKLKPAKDFETGSKWQYCNTNYIFIASIIARVSKQPVETFLAQNIFQPLKMKDTYAYNVLMPSIPANHVKGLKYVNARTESNDLTVLDGVVGDGNIYSSVEDLYLWDQSLYKVKIVRPETFALALQPARLTDGTTYPYGFGWGIDTAHAGSYSHTGGWAGFGNIIMRDTKNNRTMICLNSASTGWGNYYARNFFNGTKAASIPCYLIHNVTLVDGTGAKPRKGAVRVEGKMIVAVGDLQPLEGEIVIDGQGKVLSPGFIDTHSHVGGSLTDHPDGLAAISQGITTIVEGQDGGSYLMDSVRAMITRNPIGVNVANYTGHATLREMVMGEKDLWRQSRPEELEKMKALLKSELDKGSLGISTGLEYEEGFYSNYEEVLALSKVAAVEHSRYISHIRSEDMHLSEALEEIINIGREAKLPVQISHFKIALRDRWGQAGEILAQLQEARAEGVDITADVYPYVAWHSTLRVLFPKKDFDNVASAQYACDHLIDPAGSVIARFKPKPEYAGKTLSQIAGMRNSSPAQTLVDLVKLASTYRDDHPDEGGVESIMGKSMSDEDLKALLAWPYSNVCSDGANGGHPRGYGTFPKVLAKYVREEKTFPIEEAVRKMTSLSAEHTGIRYRGIIAPGMIADLVLFDPATVKDNSTVENSKAVATGILKVWVNGKQVYEDGRFLGAFPGELIVR